MAAIRTWHHRLVLAATIALTPLTGASAQSATPLDAARAMSQAMHVADFATAARLTHPAALRQLHDLFMPVLDSEMFPQVGPMFGLKTRDEVKTVADTTLFANLLGATMQKQPAMLEALRTATTTVIGAVPQGADTAFVVVRNDINVKGISIVQYEVQPYARYQGQWRALMRTEFTNLAAMMRRAMEAAEGPIN